MRHHLLAEMRQGEKKEAIEQGAEIYKDLTIERKDEEGRLTARLWMRKQAQAFAHYRFKTTEAREKYIDEQKRGADQREESRAKYHPTRDDRGKKIKDILRSAYPGREFRVRLEKYSMGESIHVYTDMLLNLTQEESDNNWKERAGQPHDWKLAESWKKKMEHDKKITDDIENLLKDFWHIRYDEYSGEILGGGNTYLHVNRFESTRVEENESSVSQSVKKSSVLEAILA